MNRARETTARDFYAILEVERQATQAEINAAFRAKARLLHPDALRGQPQDVIDEAEAQFKALSEAYEVLKDPENREAYDYWFEASPTTEVVVSPAHTQVSSFLAHFRVRARLSVSGSWSYETMPIWVRPDGDDISIYEVYADPIPGAEQESYEVLAFGRMKGRSRETRLRYVAGYSSTEQTVDMRSGPSWVPRWAVDSHLDSSMLPWWSCLAVFMAGTVLLWIAAATSGLLSRSFWAGGMLLWAGAGLLLAWIVFLICFELVLYIRRPRLATRVGHTLKRALIRVWFVPLGFYLMGRHLVLVFARRSTQR